MEVQFFSQNIRTESDVGCEASPGVFKPSVSDSFNEDLGALPVIVTSEQ